MPPVRLAACAAALLLLPSAAASAQTFCVAPVTGPTCDVEELDLPAALADSEGEPGADTVLLGATTYSAGSGSFTSTDVDDGVTIRGAGRGQTILTTGTGQDVLNLSGDSGGVVTVEDLTVQATPGDGHVGIRGGPGGLVLNRVDVSNPNQTFGNGAYNVLFQPGAAVAKWTTGTSVTGTAGIAINVQTSGAEITGVATSGNVGVVAAGSGFLIDRSRISGRANAVQVSRSGRIRDTHVVATAAASTAISVLTTVASPELEVVNATISGPATDATGMGTGVYVGASNDGRTAAALVDLSVIAGFQTAASRRQTPGGGAANLSISRTAYDASSVESQGAGTLLLAPTNLPPVFGFVGGEDFRPRWDSPLVDVGDPGDPLAPERLDAGGGVRRVDDRLDVGAYEYQRRAPSVTGATGPATLAAGAPGAFAVAGADPDPGDTVAYSWSFGDGKTATGAAPTHAYAAAGTYTWTATATDPTGLTASASGTTTVTGAGGTGTPPVQQLPPTPGPPVVDPLPPAPPLAITKASFKKRFTATARGLAFRFTLSRPAKVRIAIERTKGRKHVAVGALPTTKTLKAGAAKVAFSGTVKGRRLKPGTYRATLTAVAGATTSKAVRLTFVVTR